MKSMTNPGVVDNIKAASRHLNYPIDSLTQVGQFIYVLRNNNYPDLARDLEAWWEGVQAHIQEELNAPSLESLPPSNITLCGDCIVLYGNIKF